MQAPLQHAVALGHGVPGCRQDDVALASASFAHAAQTWQKQDGFEVGMLKDDWGKLDMPICLSMRGIFEHVEVDG